MKKIDCAIWSFFGYLILQMEFIKMLLRQKNNHKGSKSYFFIITKTFKNWDKRLLEVFRSFVSAEGQDRKRPKNAKNPSEKVSVFVQEQEMSFLVRQEKSNNGWSCINKNNSEPRSVWRKNRRRTKFTTRACGQIWSNYDLIWVFKGKFSEST